MSAATAIDDEPSAVTFPPFLNIVTNAGWR